VEKSLVLGASGFIGKNLCLALQRANKSVRGFDIGDKPECLPADMSWTRGNFKTCEGLEEALEGIDVVYQWISTSVPASAQTDRVADIENNLLPSIRLLDFCLNRKVDKIVFVSSGGTVYGPNVPLPTPEDASTNPISAYGVTKLAIEKYVGMYSASLGLASVILRLSNPYGRFQHARNNQGVISVFINRIRNGQDIEIWGDGNVIRDYIHIDDVCDAFLRVADPALRRGLYNIGTGRGYNLLDVVRTIERVTGQKARLKHLPSRTVDVDASILDIRKAGDELGWRPLVSLEEGIAMMCDWMETHPM